MDISLAGSDGLPAKAYISIRAGETRRQAPVTSKEVFRFPAGSYKSLTVDIFEKLGSAQVPVAGEDAKRVEQLLIGRPDGSKIGLSLQLDMHDPKQPVKPKPKASHQEAAVKAKNYLEDHGVQTILQEMVHSLLGKQPSDPLSFMNDFIASKRSAKAAAKMAEKPAPVPLKAAPPAQDTASLASVEVTVQGLGDEELAGFPVDVCPEEMPDISSHFSIMAELLKKDASLYPSLKGLCTKKGVPFAKVIKPGMDNRGHRMIKTAGVYAGDDESYSLFGSLIEPLLSTKYGAPAAGEEQPLDLDYCKVSPGPIDPEGKYVVSVQARLNRNLESVRFPPACSKEERREVERVLASALLDLTGELQGEYLPLAGSSSFAAQPGGMQPSDEEALEVKGALFREPDSTILLSSGVGRHWPDARGVFMANSGNFWAWLNEEDHLRLSSWQEGSDLREAFARICLAEGVLRQALQQGGHGFASNRRFGYLTSSPANAGTSFTASASVRVPLLARQMGLRQLCSKLKLSAQQTKEGVWTVSNNEKFGLSEAEIVQRVISGCRELVDRERQLELESTPEPALELKAAAPAGNAEAEAEEEGEEEEDDEEGCLLSDLPGLGAEEYPGFSATECPAEMPDVSSNFSLMSDVLKKDPSVYENLKGQKTKLGVHFAKVIKPGIDVKGHAMIKTVGAVAGDEESYEVFKQLFDQIIAARHGSFSEGCRQKILLDPLRVDDTPVDPTGRIVLATRVSATRNLRGFRLPSACSFDERREVERVASEALLSLNGRLEGDYYPLLGSASFPGKPEGMTEEQEEWLQTARLLFKEPDSLMLLASGVGRHWPDARGVFATEQADFAACINDEDHLRLSVREQGPCVVEAFARLCRAHECLEAALVQQGHSFMLDERLGFLTSCPSALGSGLKVGVSVDVPNLTEAGKLREVCKGLQLQVNSSGGTSPTCWELTSTLGLGASEVDIVNSVVRGCRYVVQVEEALGRGGAIALPGLGPSAAPGFPCDRCPAVLPNLSGHANHLTKVLLADSAIYQDLRTASTSLGVTFAQVIKPGVDARVGASKEVQPAGVVAGDAESYRAFARVFEPCIQGYHGLSPTGMHPCALDPTAVEGGVIGTSGQVLSVCVRLARNLGGLRMTSACSLDERREVERAVSGALFELTGTLQGDYHPLPDSRSYPGKPKGMHPFDEKALQAAGLLFKEPKAPALLAAGMGRDWPDARGVFASEDRNFAAWVNEEEHVTLISGRKDGDIKAAFASACAAEKALGLALEQDGYSFARCNRLGYLSAWPERLGTGLALSAMLHLPKHSAAPNLPSVLAAHGLKVVSMGRDGFVEVGNQATLGVSEAGLVSAFAAACTKLLEAQG